MDLAPASDVSSTLPANTLGVWIHVNRQPETFLARLAGIQTLDVNTDATALAETLGTAPAGIMVPVALKEGTYDAGQVYDLTDGKDAPSVARLNPVYGCGAGSRRPSWSRRRGGSARSSRR